MILIALCQAWMGVFSAVVYAGPTVALKICPMVSALSAFTSGFLVPEPNMPDPFWVLFFINPTFWAIQGECCFVVIICLHLDSWKHIKYSATWMLCIEFMNNFEWRVGKLVLLFVRLMNSSRTSIDTTTVRFKTYIC